MLPILDFSNVLLVNLTRFQLLSFFLSQMLPENLKHFLLFHFFYFSILYLNVIKLCVKLNNIVASKWQKFLKSEQQKKKKYGFTCFCFSGQKWQKILPVICNPCC